MLRRVQGSAADTWSGASYERIAETFATIHDRAVEEFAAGRDVRLLDVGCRTGGVDTSGNQLVKARHAAQTEGLDIRSGEGDCEQLPYADAEGVYREFLAPRVLERDYVLVLGTRR
jgi:hypothetical protein